MSHVGEVNHTASEFPFIFAGLEDLMHPFGMISPYVFPLEDKASRVDIAKGQLSSQEGEL